MFRTDEVRIQRWIDSGKGALLIYGARQVGKTWLIREMLKRNEIHYLEINLLEREDIRRHLAGINDARELSRHLALYADRPLEPGNSVIFLDEIQLYPEIVTYIKFLVDEGKYRYVFSGSNLGVELKGIRSMPVGYVDQWQMYPMTLFEFSIAMGARTDTMDYLEACFRTGEPVDPVIHAKMLRSFYYYLMAGGMPAAVKVLIEEQNLAALDAEQKSIINLYKADFIKYENENKRLKIISIYDTIPSQLNKQNRRFTFTYLNKELKFDRYEESFLWLKDAAVAIPVYNAHEVRCPLEQSKASNLFKLYQSDVGLLTSCYPAGLRQEIMRMNPELQINYGSLFENFVACELTAVGHEIYFYKTQKIGEIDFLIEKDDRVVPIEVKSGTDYKKHKSLDLLMAREAGTIKEAVVLSANNLEQSGPVLYCPIYMTSFLCPEKVPEGKIDTHLF